MMAGMRALALLLVLATAIMAQEDDRNYWSYLQQMADENYRRGISNVFNGPSFVTEISIDTRRYYETEPENLDEAHIFDASGPQGSDEFEEETDIFEVSGEDDTDRNIDEAEILNASDREIFYALAGTDEEETPDLKSDIEHGNPAGPGSVVQSNSATVGGGNKPGGMPGGGILSSGTIHHGGPSGHLTQTNAANVGPSGGMRGARQYLPWVWGR